MRIRAAVLEEFGAPLEVQELELAEPQAGEVLVRLVACGVCHTDLYTASGADPSGYSPTVLGHEGAGVVERVGDGVMDVAPGDHVVTLFSALSSAAAYRAPSESCASTCRTIGSRSHAGTVQPTRSSAARARCSRSST